jgi:ribosomal protein S18 acetylase RimI-like enzyme
MNNISQEQQLLNPIIFRLEVQPEDRNIVREIVASTGVFSPVEIDVAVELVDDRLEKGSRSDYHFVFAQRAGHTLGYACYGPIPLTAASYDLYWIAVNKPFQGQKIGHLLLAKSEELVIAAGGSNIYIETSNRAQYAPTRGFYLRQGYQQEALLKDFYSPGDDKVIYSKKVARDK